MSAAAVVAPIIDLRSRLHWRQRLPGRFSTGVLWLGTFSLLGPLKLAGVLLAASLVAPPALLLQRGRRQPQLVPWVATARPPAAELPRAVVAAQLGLPESQLFRARHAAICTVHHDDQGRIVALALPCPAPVLMTSSSDAHPVG